VSRLVHLGNVLVDVVAAVPALPARGADVLATSLGATVGGGFNLMSAASRRGVVVDYAGAHGTGPFGDLIRAALAGGGITALCPPRPTDSAVVVVIVDGDGERTLLSSPVGVAGPTAAELAGVRPAAGDVVSLTGYGLLEPASRVALLDWLPRLPAGVLVAVDPGPLAPSAQPVALRAVLARADWVSASAREAVELTGLTDPERAADALAARTRRGALVRTGAAGCVLAESGTAPLAVPGVAVRPVDTTGAGDTHTGVFLAALLSGQDAPDAARTANAAAAFAVTRRGPATAPTAAELAAFLARPVDG
jgi:sugar/nucleoside kinase (ribokinase family)